MSYVTRGQKTPRDQIGLEYRNRKGFLSRAYTVDVRVFSMDAAKRETRLYDVNPLIVSGGEGHYYAEFTAPEAYPPGFV